MPSTLNSKLQDVNSRIPEAIKIGCEMIRSTILNDMAHTARNTSVTYYSGKHHDIPHHPSLPGNPPAPDTGNLRASIHYTTSSEGDTYIGRVGTDVEYGKHLEFGTTNIAPRPWLKPSFEKNIDEIKKLFLQVVKK